MERAVKYIFYRCVFPLWLLPLLLLPAINLQAKYDPALSFRTIKTEHFYIHFHQGQEARAQKLAELAETQHRRLIERTGYQPFFRTHLVLSDIFDAANGYASFEPWNRVEMLAAKPLPDSMLGYYRDWDTLLFAHEYTHTLTLDQIAGLPSLSRYLLGRVWFPNTNQPAWLIEGSAVDEESVEGFGRNNSPLVEMVFRTEAEGKTLKSINRSSVPIRDWPAEHVHYLYGGRFIAWLRKKYPDKNPHDIHRENADNVWPYLNNTNSVDVFGEKFTVLWEKWLEELEEEQRALLERIRSEGITPLEGLTAAEFYQTYPRFADGNTLYFLRENNYERATLRKIDLAKRNSGIAKTYKIQELNSPLFLTVRKKAPFLLDLEFYRSFSLYADLFNGLSGQQLTERLRGFSLDHLPSGELVLVTQDAGLFSLALHSADGKQKEVLLGPTERTLAHARSSPAGDAIVFTARSENSAANHLYLLTLPARELLQLTSGNAIDLHPAFSADGQTIVFASNRKAGVFNLYELDLKSRELRRLTNLTGGAFYPDYSPDGKNIALSEFAPGGYRIALYDRQKKPLERNQLQFAKVNSTAFVVPPPKSGAAPIQPYSIFPSVLPSSWSPEIWLNSSSQLASLGFSLYGVDALWRDFWGMNLLYDKTEQTAALSLFYENSRFYPDFFFAPKVKAGNACNGLCNAGIEANMLVPYLKYYTRHYGYLGASYDYTKEWDEHIGYIFLGYAFSNTQFFSRSISPENGRRVGVSVTANRESASFFNTRAFSRLYSVLSYAEYLPGFFRNHVWLLRALWEHSWNVDNAIVLWRAYTPYDYYSAPQIRGYASTYAGQGLVLATLEYRFPLWQPDWGFFRVPFFFRDFYGKIFADAVQAYHAARTWAAPLQRSAGVEIGHNNVFGFRYLWNAYLGYARGFDAGGEHQIYFGIVGFTGVLWAKYSPHSEWN